MGTKENPGDRRLQGSLLEESPVVSGPGLSLVDQQKNPLTSADEITQLLFGARQYPCMGTVRPRLVRGFWGRHESPDQL